MNSIAEVLGASVNGVSTRQCPTHGEYTSRHYIGRIWSKCPTCSAEKTAEEDRLAAEQAAEAKRRAWQERLQHSCIPERFHDRTLKNFQADTPEQARALEFATRYADEFDAVMKTGRCAMFIGAPGTGKTHLAAGIALRLMHRDKRSVLFTTVMRAIRSIKDTWSKGSELTETQAIEALVFPDLLILDEVGVQFGSDTEKLMLFDVLNERYEKRKPCLLLSNLSIDDVKAYLGERVFDRLREDGGEAVAFDWASHRGRNQEAA